MVVLELHALIVHTIHAPICPAEGGGGDRNWVGALRKQGTHTHIHTHTM